MDYKINNLKDKIRLAFIRGEYGPPKIPSNDEIFKKIEETTSDSYSPITSKERLSELDYSVISGKFSNIIDDLDILYKSIEDESLDILNQLTSSIKEYNGVKRELRHIKSRTEDISTGKLGEEYLEYNFTESFNDIENINTIYSSPIDTDAGIFTLLNSSSNLLTLNHYRDRKLEFNVTESYSKIEEYGYVGDNNATSVLSKNDPRSITYRIKTARVTPIKVALALQLMPDGKPVEINAVGISLDSSLSKGYIRLFYQTNFQWKDVPTLSLQEIKGDTVLFNFPVVSASHIKFEFIKDFPDIPNTNEFLININEIAISKGSNKHSARLYSKPIVVESYSTEEPVINNISCSIDADIPEGCAVKVYVAQDMPISGQFVDKNGLPVYSDSLEAVNYSPLVTGFVYLSDMWARDGLSGLDPYKGLDFNWKELNPLNKDHVPEIIEFNTTTNHIALDNSLFNVADWYLYGDNTYSGAKPQYPEYGTVFISGWCNSDNPAWSSFLSGAVDSGWFVSGANIAALIPPYPLPYNQIEDSDGNIHPDILNNASYSGQWLGYGKGYPLNYYNESNNEYWRFGEYKSAVNGWWRPYTEAVTPTGINQAYISISGASSYLDHIQYGLTFPDFYFNNLKFYKIHKFSYTQNVIEPSIRLYCYEDRPINTDNDYYAHTFVWSYKSDWTIENSTSLDLQDINHNTDDDFANYVIELPPSNESEEYIIDGVNEVKLHNTSVLFEKNRDYTIIQDSEGRPSGVLMSPLNYNYRHLKPSGVSFDITYSTKLLNRFASTWTSYAIVCPGVLGTVVVTNPKLYTTVQTQIRIVNKIVVENLDDNTTVEYNGNDNSISFQLDAGSSSTNKHFKVTLYCASDGESGFSGRSTRSPSSHFIPSESRHYLNVSKGIKFVAKLEAIKLVELSTLLYDTPMTSDKRCSIITDSINEKYLIVKAPSKDIFPGYYFDNVNSNYYYDSRIFINNKGHFIRKYQENGKTNIYTTGSSGVIVTDPYNIIDNTWNDGSTLPEYRNTLLTQSYPNHSTWGYPITLDDSCTIKWTNILRSGNFDLRPDNRSDGQVGSENWRTWLNKYNTAQLGEYDLNATRYGHSFSNIIEEEIPNRGYLFYNTGENLPAFYSISYRTVTNIDPSYSRFLYKIELENNSSNSIVPTVRSVRFRINRND